ncbi:maltokinase [Streptomyces sp. SID5785]|uniref:maltokinase N-terminal cap-like domain-containing protein n=1 Tax=Streptomyces sp. SID5785 TaxID=2690309 RepID=UPI0013619E8B|nr:phosphotransferase [Streptomyces sp. SID5785]MZD10281.1 maltokinase [Streptomyces sp. SID5785]
MLKTVPHAPGRRDPSPVLASLEGPLAAWLPEQRWFAGKGLALTGLDVVAMTELYPGCLHLLVRATHAGAHSGCYQLLLGVTDRLPARLRHAVVGRPSAGPLRGRTVYDALHDPRAAALLLERLRVPGAAGPLRFEKDAGSVVPTGLSPRMLDGEQSNTSLVYGDAYILKLFRRVQYGIHPDLEVPAALAGDGCTRVPSPVAWFWTTEPRRATLGVLQPFLSGATDGWTLALGAGGGPDLAARSYELGRATAEVHLALGRAFAAEAPAPGAPGGLAAAMTARLEATARQVPELAPYVPRLMSVYAAAAAHHAGPADQRVHGDLHLGQVLLDRGRWQIIDFEGEPSRPLAERRQPQSPARDVAGMLRSFAYAAHARGPGHSAWAERCRTSYVAGYAAHAAWDPREHAPLVRAHETDRAVYEVLYEARNRPDWLPVPMAAIARLAEESRT